ncbi:hypothetical protein JRO89_XS11G0016500 [Xanthoceras sorbifolium]|uniref:GDSL esterase/lipase n=1 Tax=Xanthoceras sorbifolium TaxID=99658 RepID=A0ABQ8HEH0_9ROSI|nr:hypothetical protein JRO89_XS11G0016500 [Xanthoceras sorbifolium]
MEMRNWTNSFLLFTIFLDLISGSHGDVFRVPALDANQKDLLQLLELGDDIKFDVPALYVFGDSTVDSGNNNFLSSTSKANYSPFGIDFVDGKATGRFSNGRTKADFIAQVVGLPFPSPCLGLSKEEQKILRTGVNYGSSACGILPDTGKFFGTCLNFEKQIDLFETTVKNLQSSFDSKESMANYLSKSLFFISIGNADVSTGYDFLDNNTKQQTPFPNFAQAISQNFSSKIRKLYDLGARKFLVSNVGMTDTRDTCCVAAENGTRPCIRDIAPCNNRNEHVYFDPFHASESTHFILAKRCLKESSICTPISLVDLLRA